MFGAGFVLAAIITTVPVSAPEADAATATRFVMRRAGKVIVPATVDGAGPFAFLLDTGSSHSVIADTLAARIAAVPVARTTVSTPAGTETRNVVNVGRVTIGPISRTNVLASVVKRRTLDGDDGLDGLIGQDVLGGLRYTIDYKRRWIEWYAGAIPAGRGDELCLDMDDGRFVVQLPQSDTILRLIPDSAAQGLVIFDRRNRRLPRLSFGSGSVTMTTLTSRRAVRPIALPVLQVGSGTLRDVPAVLADDKDDSEIDGLLPLHIFGRVTFDGPGRRLIVAGR